MRIRELRDHSRVTSYKSSLLSDYECYLLSYADLNLKDVMPLLGNLSDHIEFDTSTKQNITNIEEVFTSIEKCGDLLGWVAVTDAMFIGVMKTTHVNTSATDPVRMLASTCPTLLNPNTQSAASDRAKRFLSGHNLILPSKIPNF